jgi:hypothetical protein
VMVPAFSVRDTLETYKACSLSAATGPSLLYLHLEKGMVPGELCTPGGSNFAPGHIKRLTLPCSEIQGHESCELLLVHGAQLPPLACSA